MYCPAIVFVGLHVTLFALIATAYPPQYRVPLYMFGLVQSLIEHYADVFPAVAALGPPLIPVALGLLGTHYYYANKVISNKYIVWGGLAYYVAIIAFSKGFELGFPKDTAEEQIEALEDESYITNHFIFHLALLSCLSMTAFSLPTNPKAKAK